MILSVSRRTDIPAFYFDWFLKRIEEGFLYVRNPMNPKQVSKILINKNVVDCIVFWTKNPERALEKLDKLEDYMFYFQYTVNPYDHDIEKNVPNLDTRIKTFIKLSQKIGKDRVIWRYDPIFLTDKIDVEFHLEKFEEMVNVLGDYTETMVISILDDYRKIKKNMESLSYRQMSQEELSFLMKNFRNISDNKNLKIYSCAEDIDLVGFGIEAGRCIDQELISRLLQQPIEIKKDKNQRDVCGCVESIEVGVYNTCVHSCRYCYANFSDPVVRENNKNHDINSPMLIGNVEDKDRITERKIKRFRSKTSQISMFD
ncbi:protein of unknown function [Natronincola peptidivorans]|uniref:DUF1848 domain-containing protein n=1 Tax=Natronincola peptidivorans TaxID=426128 RepID=A0A1I0EJJ8_9FIRM|nr:DUF1848 domain-containing protein [Natronincola peptidivorans]SET45591.1 protein of unknown function [Natronincola peptidivorans]